MHPSRSRWIQGDYVAFGRCVQVEYLGGLEALNAGFAVFGIGVAHAFDIIVRFVRKGDVSVRVGLFLEGVDRDIGAFDGVVAFVGDLRGGSNVRDGTVAAVPCVVYLEDGRIGCDGLALIGGPVFLDGRIAFDSAILFDGAIAFVVQASQPTSPPYAAWSISPKVPFQNGALYSFAAVYKAR